MAAVMVVKVQPSSSFSPTPAMAASPLISTVLAPPPSWMSSRRPTASTSVLEIYDLLALSGSFEPENTTEQQQRRSPRWNRGWSADRHTSSPQGNYSRGHLRSGSNSAGLTTRGNIFLYISGRIRPFRTQKCPLITSLSAVEVNVGVD